MPHCSLWQTHDFFRREAVLPAENDAVFFQEIFTIPVQYYNCTFGLMTHRFAKNLSKNKGSRLSLLNSENVSANN
jgi:hypothetical protein